MPPQKVTIQGEYIMHKRITAAIILLTFMLSLCTAYASGNDVIQNPEYFPANGSIDVAVDTECYVKFPSAIDTESVTAESVTVNGDKDTVVSSVEIENSREVVITFSGLKANTNYDVKLSKVKNAGGNNTFNYGWSFTTGSAVSFSAPYVREKKEDLTIDYGMLDLSEAVAVTDEEYEVGGVVRMIGDDYDFKIQKGYLTSMFTPLEANRPLDDKREVKVKFSPIDYGDTLKIKAVVMVDNAKNHDYIHGKLKLQSSSTSSSLSLFGAWKKAYAGISKRIGFMHSNLADGAKVDFPATEVGTIGSGYYATGAKMPDDQMIVVNDNCAKIAGVPITIEFEAKPSSTYGYYDLNAHYTNIENGTDLVYSKQISASEITSFDEISFLTVGSGTTTSVDFMSVKSLELERAQGVTANMTETFKIDYENLSGENFEAKVVIIERDSETGVVINVDVIDFEDISNENGYLPVDYTPVENSVVDVYVMNSVDGMIMLSKPTSFGVM